MTSVLHGVRVLEVAEHTFVPAASALLADWGADVIKIEPVERGDAMRGLASTGVVKMPNNVHALFEHSNRGKKSLALDLTTPEGLDIVYRLAESSDVFLTNKLPRVRTKLKIDVDDLRARNPSIIYVRGTGHGERGPDADKGSYDSLAFWCRSGVAMGGMPTDATQVPIPPAPGFGDSIGAMTIAGGIMGALFHRERTGEASTVDISLLGTGLWAMGQAVALSLLLDLPWRPPGGGGGGGGMAGNPLVGNYGTKDGRFVSLTCLQAGKYWAPLVEVVGRPELATDARFADHETLLANGGEARQILRAVFAERTLDEWKATLSDFVGQWAAVQDTLEASTEPQSVANGYIQECHTASGTPFGLVAAPVQFDEVPAVPQRAPEFNEHGDEVLGSLGLDYDAILDLKVRGVVA